MMIFSIGVLSCLLCCSYTSYLIGKKHGISNTIEWFESMSGNKKTLTLKFIDEDIEFIDK